MSVKNFIEKHPKLNYMQRCIRRAGDETFVAEVLDIGKNPLTIKINRMGDKNYGKTIYIAQTMGCDGFFAELRFLVAELYFADAFGFVPVVQMPRNSFYAETEEINGTSNPFEYYFNPVSDVEVKDACESYAVVEHNWYQRDYIHQSCGMNSGYLPSEQYMTVAAEIVQKYIQLNSIVSPQVTQAIDALIGGSRTIGVQVRGADFQRHYKNHPNIVTIDEYIEATEKALNEFGFEKIFLATDDLNAIESFKQKFGNRVVYYDDVIRTDGDETVMRSVSEREHHHYKLGLEVIRDVYTLASCDGIVAGLSNVSIFARIVKMSRKSDYEYKNYINKGIKN